jgi:phospholipase C
MQLFESSDRRFMAVRAKDRSMTPKSARLAGFTIAAVLASEPSPAQEPSSIDKLSHIMVLYLENRSFDNLFGEFPRASGLASAGDTTQRDGNGKPFAMLPAVPKPFDRPENSPELRAIESLDDLPNKPFRTVNVRPGVTTATHTRDLVHAFYTHRTQINGGKNDLFAAYSDAKGLVMSYYSADDLKDTHLWRLAQRYTLLDNFFMGAFVGSFLNHFWLVCACAPIWPDPPESQRSEVDDAGRVVADRRVTANGDGDYAVNTTQSILFNNGRQGKNVLPAQDAVTIGDRLSEKGVSWAWYSGGRDLAVKSNRTSASTAASQTLHPLLVDAKR